MPIADSSPSMAPTGAAMPTFCSNVASRKNTDSSPSRPTARNTIPTRAQDWPVSALPLAPIACSIERCKVAFIERAACCIHSTIELRIITAISPTTPSNNSCCFCGNSALARSSATPAARHSSEAATAPIQTDRSQALRPVWRR